MTLNDLILKIKASLKNGEVENFENEAICIVEKAVDMNRTEVMLNRGNIISEAEADKAYKMAEKRLSGAPLQYCIGEWDFMGETFEVGEGVLIPRPETEELCEYVIDKIKDLEKPSVIDLCAGTGCIGLTIKKKVPSAYVRLVEKSMEAFEFLSRNTDRHIKNQFIILTHGDVLRPQDFEETIDQKVDVIVSNPPYIKTADIAELQKEVLCEPKMALDGGEDGYKFYRVICREWPRYLKEGGFVALECGEGQAEYICTLFDKNEFETEIIKDFALTDRFVIGRKKIQ